MKRTQNDPSPMIPQPLATMIPAGRGSQAHEDACLATGVGAEYDWDRDICREGNGQPGGEQVTVTNTYITSVNAHTPVESRDTIRSRSYMRLIDLLCEGEIEGLCDVSGNVLTKERELGKGIYYNGIPLLNDSGQPNFGEFTMGVRYGTADQFALPGFGESADVIQVGAEIKRATPAVVVITNPAAESVEIGIRLPALLYQKSNGDVGGTTVRLKVLISRNGGPFEEQAKLIVIKGKASNPFVKSESYVLPQGDTPGANNWQIRVERLTRDSNSVRLTNGTTLDYIVTQTVNAFNYPHSAIVGIELNAQQFPSVPSRSYHVKGLRVKVPDNYFPGDLRRPVSYDRDPATGDKVVTGVLTAKRGPVAGEWVRVGQKTYTWAATITGLANVDGNVKVGANSTASFQNLLAALNLSAGSGATYAAAMTANTKVSGTSVTSTLAELVMKLTDTATAIANNKTVTIDDKAYRFRTALGATPAEGDVAIAGSPVNAFRNLVRAILHVGTPNVDYKCAAAHPTVTTTNSPDDQTITLKAKTAGADGNTIGATSTVPGIKFQQTVDGALLDSAAFLGGTDVLTVAALTPGDKITAALGFANAAWVGIEQVWTGGFYTAWTSNPAWCFYDILTNTRYGLGNHIDVTQVDKWGLYRIGRYCDEEVDDGFGNRERRFGCHTYIQSQEEAWKVIQDFASAFRGMAYWANGAVMCAQDRPWSGPPIAIFTKANTVGGFTYSGTSKTARHTTVTVRWNDPSDFWRSKFEFVSNGAGLQKYGENPLNVVAFGCTSRGQAHRVGKWILATELNQTDTVSFVTGLEGAALRPGDRITVMDNDRAGVQQSGRVLAISEDRKRVTLDRNVELPDEGTSTFTVSRARDFKTPDEVADSTEIDELRTPQAETVDIAGQPAANVLEFAAALPEAVLPMAVWVIETPELVAQDFRVIGAEEQEDGNYAVTALETHESKFAAVEGGLEFESIPITALPPTITQPATVNALSASLQAAALPEQVKPFIEVTWEMPPDGQATSFLIETRRVEPAIEDDGTPSATESVEENWAYVGETAATSTRLEYFAPGDYEIAVTTVDRKGRKSFRMVHAITVPPTNPIEPYRISGLMLQGQPNATTFVGRDAKFAWRLNSPVHQEEFGEELLGADTAAPDPFFQDFVVTILDPDTGAEWFREVTVETFWVFTYAKNLESLNGPHSRFTIVVEGRDKYGNTGNQARLTVENPAPGAVTDVTLVGAWRMMNLAWTNPADTDLDVVDILESTTGEFADATLVATVSGHANTWVRTDAEIGTTYTYWLRTRDTFGSVSPIAPTLGISVTAGSLPVEDIANFAIDATKLFLDAIVLRGDIWTNHAPTTAAISWNGHDVVFRGVRYAIASGNTALQYVWWKGPVLDGAGAVVTPGENVYRTSDAHPKDAGLMGPNDFVIATNAGNLGVYDLAWRGIANAVIGTAHIKRAAIVDAQIDNVSANKLTAGTITGELIQVGGGGAIQSSNYVASTAGWRINGDGTAELNALAIREALSVGTGYFNEAFPSRIFSAQPTQLIPFSIARTYLNKSGYPIQEFDTSSFAGGSDGITKRGKVFYPGWLDDHGWPIRSAAIFAGVDCEDFDYIAGDGPIGTHAYDIAARPFRLAFDGLNLFTIRVDCKVNTHLGVFFQTGTRPHSPRTLPTQDTTNSLGNVNLTTGSGAGTGNQGRKWTMCGYMKEETSATGRQQLTLATRVLLNVPKDRWILFGVAPMSPTGSVAASGTPGVSDYTLVNGAVTVTAENVSGVYPSAEIPEGEP